MQIRYLIENKERRGRQYIFAEKRRKINYIKKFSKGTPEFDELNKKIKDGMVINTIAGYDNLLDSLKTTKAVIDDPKYKEIKKEYYRLINLKRYSRNGDKNPPWFAYFDEYHSVFSLFKAYNSIDLYELQYRNLSETSHGLDEMLNLIKDAGNGNAFVLKGRLPHEAPSVTIFALGFSRFIFTEYLRAFIDEDNWQAFIDRFGKEIVKNEEIRNIQIIIK